MLLCKTFHLKRNINAKNTKSYYKSFIINKEVGVMCVSSEFAQCLILHMQSVFAFGLSNAQYGYIFPFFVAGG